MSKLKKKNGRGKVALKEKTYYYISNNYIYDIYLVYELDKSHIK